MREQTLREKVYEELAKLPPSRLEPISREALLEGPRIELARRIDIPSYHRDGREGVDTRVSHDDRGDLSLAKLPVPPLDLAKWRSLISGSAQHNVSLAGLFDPAFGEQERFPTIVGILRQFEFAPPAMWYTLFAQEVHLIPDRELRPLLLQREARQELNRQGVRRLLPELTGEISRAVASLHSELKVSQLQIPIKDIDTRLERLHIEVFDPLQSSSFTDVAFYSILSHTIFVSADLQPSDYKPILRHEMLHGVSGLAPVIVRASEAALKDEQLSIALKESFYWERHALLSLGGKESNYQWLNEGVTEFLNQTVGRVSGQPSGAIHGWGHLAEMIRKLSERTDISPLLNMYFSDAPSNDPWFQAQRAQLDRNLRKISCGKLFNDLERVWGAERRQDSLLKVYNEQYSSRGFWGTVFSALRLGR